MDPQGDRQKDVLMVSKLYQASSQKDNGQDPKYYQRRYGHYAFFPAIS
tara:strand:+ start:309 stop:452 length:144 start_codon:yes stop_codon:yes gene_type:complete